MKRKLVFLALGLAGMVTLAFAGDTSVVVSNIATVVAGPAYGENWPAWSSNTAYAIGAVVRSEGRNFVAARAGTSSPTNYPKADGYYTDGTVLWLSCLPGRRSGLILGNDSTNSAVYYGFGRAVVNSGGRMNAGGGAVAFAGDGTPQGAVLAVSALDSAGLVTSNRVTILEW